MVEQLVDRIRNPSRFDEPYIIQDRVPQTRSRHVVVIWDVWEEMGRLERSRIIAHAYRDAGIEDAIRVALGLTQQEALSMGYLPYQIMPNWKKTDGAEVRAAIERAIVEAHGVHLRTGTSEQLHYPTLEHAQEAYRQLTTAVPGPYWTIVKDLDAGE